MDDCANEWTLEIIPERVRNVPKMVRKNVSEMRKTFQTLSRPRRSWSMTECTYALAVKNGMQAAFSTGSQPQYPPQPSSSYAQSMPSVLPMPRNIQAKSVHFRLATIHS